jgi:hypothetical protein
VVGALFRPGWWGVSPQNMLLAGGSGEDAEWSLAPQTAEPMRCDVAGAEVCRSSYVEPCYHALERMIWWTIGGNHERETAGHVNGRCHALGVSPKVTGRGTRSGKRHQRAYHYGKTGRASGLEAANDGDGIQHLENGECRSRDCSATSRVRRESARSCFGQDQMYHQKAPTMFQTDLWFRKNMIPWQESALLVAKSISRSE